VKISTQRRQGLQLDRVAQRLKPVHEATFNRWPCAFVKGIGPEVVVGLTSNEQAVVDDQDRVGDRYGRAFRPLAGQESPGLRAQGRGLRPSGGLGGLDEGRAQPGTPFAGGRRATLACACVVPQCSLARAPPRRPNGPRRSRRMPVSASLRDELSRRAPSNLVKASWKARRARNEMN
jgi:hypothetical protein